MKSRRKNKTALYIPSRGLRPISIYQVEIWEGLLCSVRFMWAPPWLWCRAATYHKGRWVTLGLHRNECRQYLGHRLIWYYVHALFIWNSNVREYFVFYLQNLATLVWSLHSGLLQPLCIASVTYPHTHSFKKPFWSIYSVSGSVLGPIEAEVPVEAP